MVTRCVLMLAWPMTTDQFANARLLVDDLCTAVPVNWGGLNAAPGGDEVASMRNTAIGTTREVGEVVALRRRSGGRDSWQEAESRWRVGASTVLDSRSSSN
jgi:hypothetical protein